MNRRGLRQHFLAVVNDGVGWGRALENLIASCERGIQAMPGERNFLTRLGGTRSAIVTSGSRTLTTSRFERLGLPLPPVIVCGDDIEQGKLRPEWYLLAREQFDVPSTEAVPVPIESRVCSNRL